MNRRPPPLTQCSARNETLAFLHHYAGVAGNTLGRQVRICGVGGCVVVRLTGHNSAASFPTGPVMAEPFISPLGLTIWEVIR